MAKESTSAIPAAPVDVKASVPIEVKLTAGSVAALGGDAGVVTPTAEPMLPATTVPVVPQATTTTTTTTAPQPTMVAKSEELTLAPTTTAADDEVTKGQRHINRLWEYTQAIIAIMVVATTLFVLSVLALRVGEITVNSVLIAGQIVVMATYIVNTYFQRTNHVLQGGVGPKTYESR